MRMLVFFDLPMETGEEKRNYREFRKALIKNGFIMLQKSVYSKVLLTPSVGNSAKNLIHRVKPPKGLVQTLTVTEKQFAKMEFIVRESNSEYIDNDERLVIL